MNEKLQETIENYLNGALTTVQKKEFESALNTDPELARQVDLHRKAGILIDHANYQADKAWLASIEKEMVRGEGTVRRLTIRRWSVAASFLVLIGLAGWLFTSSRYSDASLSKQFFATSELEQQRSSNGQIEMPFDVQLLNAQALFSDGDYEKAREIYRTVAASDTDLAPKAEWNLLMTHFAESSCDSSCQSRIREIAGNPDNPYYERAASLVKRLDSRLYRLAN